MMAEDSDDVIPILAPYKYICTPMLNQIPLDIQVMIMTDNIGFHTGMSLVVVMLNQNPLSLTIQVMILMIHLQI